MTPRSDEVTSDVVETIIVEALTVNRLWRRLRPTVKVIVGEKRPVVLLPGDSVVVTLREPEADR